MKGDEESGTRFAALRARFLTYKSYHFPYGQLGNVGRGVTVK